MYLQAQALWANTTVGLMGELTWTKSYTTVRSPVEENDDIIDVSATVTNETETIDALNINTM